MTIFVDDFIVPWGHNRFCHLLCDEANYNNLHDFAESCGVLRRMFQGDHYQLPVSKRGVAIGLGARLITWREAGAMMKVHRETGTWPPQRKAIEALHNLRRPATPKPGDQG